MGIDALRVFDAFAEQFDKQLLFSGPPASEHAVHLCLAISLAAAGLYLPGDVVFEKPIGRRRVDIWLRDDDAAIEVKFWRPIPSGTNLPWTQHLGGLLSDFGKLASEPFGERWVVLVTDQRGYTYLSKSASGLVPVAHPRVVPIGQAEIDALPATARTRAVRDGPWTPLVARLVHETRRDDWNALCWRIERQADQSSQ